MLIPCVRNPRALCAVLRVAYELTGEGFVAFWGVSCSLPPKSYCNPSLSCTVTCGFHGASQWAFARARTIHIIATRHFTDLTPHVSCRSGRSDVPQNTTGWGGADFAKIPTARGRLVVLKYCGAGRGGSPNPPCRNKSHRIKSGKIDRPKKRQQHGRKQ